MCSKEYNPAAYLRATQRLRGGLSHSCRAIRDCGIIIGKRIKFLKGFENFIHEIKVLYCEFKVLPGTSAERRIIFCKVTTQKRPTVSPNKNN